jgi:hypothetical protein
MTEQAYEDDENLRSILDVLKAAELFGEVISVRNLVSSDELDTEDTEDDDWADIQTKYGHDTSDYVFDHIAQHTDGWTITPIASTISLETEPVSGHDWIAPVTLQAHALVVTLDGMSECGKPLTKCSNFECKHDSWVKTAEWLPQERYEFKQDWNSMADRPTENFFMGLPGLRYIENDQTHFTRINTVCNHCYLYTPTRLETCQNCDRVLV